MFYAELWVLYLSTRQSPFWLRPGVADEIGIGKGGGFTMNVPKEVGCTDKDCSLVATVRLAGTLRCRDSSWSAGDGHGGWLRFALARGVSRSFAGSAEWQQRWFSSSSCDLRHAWAGRHSHLPQTLLVGFVAAGELTHTGGFAAERDRTLPSRRWPLPPSHPPERGRSPRGQRHPGRCQPCSAKSRRDRCAALPRRPS